MTIEWLYNKTLVSYPDAQAFMDDRVKKIQTGAAFECIWFLEHPPLYTAGRSAKASDLLNPLQLPVFETRRGGQFTYHGPGQCICYVMIDLNQRRRDVRAYIKVLEQWGIDVLSHFGAKAMRDDIGVGLWVQNTNSKMKKIAAIGVHISKWVTSHGMAFNLNPDLSHYTGIVPCGISSHGVTSLNTMGIDITKDIFIDRLKATCPFF